MLRTFRLIKLNFGLSRILTKWEKKLQTCNIMQQISQHKTSINLQVAQLCEEEIGADTLSPQVALITRYADMSLRLLRSYAKLRNGSDFTLN